ncbi:hypothetical protein [Microbulbifer sp. YPW16]|nr:hypothetical protein [Microbulbifer sp. YPW16]UHQ55381.1 hypothetical protein LVE68_18020 [Microbulbifer sp. YPW16]
MIRKFRKAPAFLSNRLKASVIGFAGSCFLAGSVTAALPAAAETQATKKEVGMILRKNGSQDSIEGPADWFTGRARIDPIHLEAQEPSRITSALVTFEPGARTNWHTHPLGQLLIVTSGKG